MIHHIHIVPGTNPNLYRTTESDPSGFHEAGLSSTDIEGLVAFVQEECNRVIALVPQGVMNVAHVPRQLEVYSIHRDGLSVPAVPVLSARGSIKHALPSVSLSRDKDDRALASLPCNAEVYGMGILCDASALANVEKRAGLRQAIGHEMLHIITGRGVSPWMRSRSEALTESLAGGIYGVGSTLEDTLANPDKYGWDGSKIQCSGGLAEPDFASATYKTSSAITALYLSAPLALRGISTESVWKIWQVLLESVEHTGCYPLSRQIRAAILDVLQKDGEKVLRNPCFKDMEGGTHVFAVSAKDDSCAVVIPLHVTRDPSFGLDAQGAYHEHYGTVGALHNRVPYQQYFHDRADRRITNIHGSGTLGMKDQFSYQTILDRARNTPAFRVLKELRLGYRMTVEIPGLQPIVLRKSQNDPQVRRLEEWIPR